jgi:HK97 gp10 family phage protein
VIIAMAMMKMEGLSEAKQALRELPDSTAKNVLRRVGRVCLQPMADHAKSLAPVEDGTLRDSIRVGTTLTRRQKSMHTKLGPDDVEIFMGAGGLPQAHMMEFGTVDVTARPYMRPAWDRGKDDLLQRVADSLWVEIEKAAARLARKAGKA